MTITILIIMRIIMDFILDNEFVCFVYFVFIILSFIFTYYNIYFKPNAPAG
jgi:hypothetical protein